MLIILIAYLTYATIAVAHAGKAWPIPIFLVIGVTLAMQLILTIRAGAYANDEGVRVRNIRRAVFVPWDEIKQFSVGQLGILPKIGILERNDGQKIGIWGIQGPNPVVRPNNRAAELVIEHLNEELNRRCPRDEQHCPATPSEN